ncbi:hypothetical protein ACIBCS_01695 [Streptomyces phaeochromogenes]|uniref:hypothetical protein n=1 Tax=Streptomyces phaeochromogenes TaxID=1923 RepID=UPI0033C18B5D
MTVTQRAAPMGVPTRALRLPCPAIGLTVDAAGLTVDAALTGTSAVAQGITRDPPASPTTLDSNACVGFAAVARATRVELART